MPRAPLWELTEDWILLHFVQSRLLEFSSPSVSEDHVSERLPCPIIDMKVQLNTRGPKDVRAVKHYEGYQLPRLPVPVAYTATGLLSLQDE